MAATPTTADPQNSTFEILLGLVKTTSAQSATLESIASDLKDLRQSLGKQMADLQERVGKTEVLNGRQEEQIKAQDETIKSLRAEVDRLKSRMWYATGAMAAAIFAVEIGLRFLPF